MEVPMNTCVIFCAAGFDGILEPILPGDLVIAADGGLRHTEKLGVAPHVILGDFDSLGYVPSDSRVFPVEKDDTDSMLAVRLGLGRGYRRFVLYGAVDGKRLDHTLANCQTLHFLSDHGAVGYLVGRDYVITALQNGTMRFPAGCEGILSLFCSGADARDVCIGGMKYNLTHGVLSAGFPLGISNHFLGGKASVSVGSGTLIALWDRKNGICETR